MDNDLSRHLEEYTQKMKDLRMRLPDVDSKEIEQLRVEISAINLDELCREDMQRLKPQFDEFIAEVNQIMNQLSHMEHHMFKEIKAVENQKMAVKAYTKAQHST